MRKIIFLGFVMFLETNSFAHAQAQVNLGGSQLFETQASPIGSALVEPGQQDLKRDLPDAPIPTLPSSQDGPMPCPAGIGKPCALLGGRLYFSDPSHMTEHDKTWFDALKNPLILGGIIADAGAAVWDLRTTRACIDNHTCKEANPLMGQSLAQQVTVGTGLNAILYYAAVRMKQRGKGNTALFFLAANAGLHVFFATYGRVPISKR